MSRRKFEVGDYCKGYWSGRIGQVIHVEREEEWYGGSSVIYYVRYQEKMRYTFGKYQWRCARYKAINLRKRTLEDVQQERIREELNS